MKHRLCLFVLLITALAGNAQSGSKASSIILKLKFAACAECTPAASVKTTGDPAVDAVGARYGALKIRRMVPGRRSHRYLYIVTFPKGATLEKIIGAYYETGKVAVAEPDGKGTVGGQPFIPNDAGLGKQWGLHNNGTFPLLPAVAGADIDMENAWGIQRGDSTMTVAVIDGGAKLDHPEFAGRIWHNNAEIPNDGIDNDNNGFPDDVQGWDFAYSDNLPEDDHGHGTNVAGIIGANGNNTIGYAGVNMYCKLMILKALDSNNTGDYSWMADAMYYAADNDARVINMSIGGASPSVTLQDAVDYAVAHGVVVVICMMNTNSSIPYYPAACPGVIAVGATNPDDHRTHPFFWDAASGSNYGSHISVVAPGNYIYGLSYLSNTNYTSYWGGTSQAAPHVAGVASLLLAQNPSMTPAQVKAILEQTAEDQVGDAAEDVPGWDQYYGYGRINAYRALGGTTGIVNRVTQQAAFSAWPNPSSGPVHIAFALPGSYNCTLTNAAGQVIYTASVNAAGMDINTQLAPGMYTLSVKSGNKYEVKKIAVQ